jgi:hypothetical protein
MGGPVAESFPSRPARRPVSRQRYIVRRVGAGVLALVVLLGAGFVVVKAVGALGGGADPEDTITGAPAAAAANTSSSTVAAPTTSAATAATASAAPPETVAPTTTAPADTGPPTAESPAEVLVVGDSDAGTFGPYLKELLDGTGVVRTTVDYKVSSGLARPDFFNWPEHLRTTLPEVQPDIVVVTFGGNDAQGLSEADGSNPAGWNDPVNAKEDWVPEYTRRAGEMMDLLAADGRTVVWVGIPNDDSPAMSERLAVQDEAVRAALATRPHVQFIDTWARFSSGNGGWAEYVVDPRDGQGKDVRADDGFHLNQNGAEILALDIFEVLQSDLESRGATL